MRPFIGAVALVPALAVSLVAAPPASAAVDVAVKSVKLTAPYAQAPTDAVIIAKVTQTSYKDISLDVELAGFRATKEHAYGKGECPTSIARVITSLAVTECGWSQEGDGATLRLALAGTVKSEQVKIRIKSGALTAPESAGVYGVFVSSWAFESMTETVTVLSGPLK